MTIKELKEILRDFDDDQFVHAKVWLNPDRDYTELDDLIDFTIDKFKSGCDGALLLTGYDKRSTL